MHIHADQLHKPLSRQASVPTFLKQSKRLGLGLLAIAMASIQSGCSSTPKKQQLPIWASNAQPVELLTEGAGEGPAWHPELGLLFSGNQSIQNWHPTKGISVHREKAGTNGLLFDHQGRLLACEPAQRRVTRRELDGTLSILTTNYQGARYNTPNDITVDEAGRIYFSDPRYGDRSSMEMKDADGNLVEGVYCIQLDGNVTRVITHEVDRPNGVLVSRDGKYLYVADNNNNTHQGARKLWRFKFKSDGTLNLRSQKLIFDWKTSRGPDGMIQDVLGRIYVAAGLNKDHPPHETRDPHPAGIYVFSSRGELLDQVSIPNDEVTNCAFGMDDLKTLFITAGGHLWSIRTAVAGHLPWPEVKH